MEKFAFVIGHRWPNGEIGAYTIHNQAVFNGTTEDAIKTLEYVREYCEDKKVKYQILKLE
jgi:hypothetical protein